MYVRMLILLSMMLFTSCESSQCMKDFYIAHKASLSQMQTLSKDLATNYSFEKVTVRKKARRLS